jgi:pyroglutamyl-peptidase
MRHDARKPVILATGFSVFPGAPDNPTEWAIGELERTKWQPEGAMLCTRVSPVRYDIWPAFAQVLAHEKPDAVVAFGLSAKATGFTLESTARNQLGLGRPDAAGIPAPAAHLHHRGVATYPSGLPLKEIKDALANADLPLAPSDDAGDYICNLVFYNLMKHIAEAGAPRLAGFIHVPYLTEQLPILTRAGLPTAHLKTMSKAQLLQGVRVILATVAAQISLPLAGRD